ncbi:hypothetical protein GCM10029964_100560 [Kibdelosporangium lantanae]
MCAWRPSDNAQVADRGDLCGQPARGVRAGVVAVDSVRVRQWDVAEPRVRAPVALVRPVPGVHGLARQAAEGKGEGNAGPGGTCVDPFDPRRVVPAPATPVEDDDELAAYNRYLAELNAKDEAR